MRNGIWCDVERQNLAAYEYLCHVGEAKEWIEACIGESLPEVSEIEDSLRDGVAMAKLARTFCPEAVGKIYQQSAPVKLTAGVRRRFVFKYTDNINFFLTAIRQVRLPRLFHFELTDLYDRKNMPRVIYCLHALSHFLLKMGIAPEMKDLVGHLEFTDAQLAQTQAELDNLGANMPSFHMIDSSIGSRRPRLSREVCPLQFEDMAEEGESSEEDEPIEDEDIETGAPAEEEDSMRINGSLEKHTRRIVGVQALVRGRLARKVYDEMRGWTTAIVQFQALCRGVLVRREVGDRLTTWGRIDAGVRQVQALARGYLVRQRIRDHRTHLKRNINVIVKMQNMYRAKLAGKAYRTLTVEDTPPTPRLVQSCAPLLEDTDQDLEEELELERLRQKAVRQIRENQQTGRVLDQLDIKIALLVRNRISLEEVLRQTRLVRGMYPPMPLVSSGAGNPPPNSLYSLRNMDKESRRKLESYQHLFYLLQTQPIYLARLLFLLNQGGSKAMRHEDISISKLIETIVLTLFGFAQNAREEYLLLKLFCAAIQIELSSIETLQEFLRGNPIFIKLAVHYNRGAKERKYLRDLLQPLIRKVIDDPELDLESDPLVIYRTLIREEESRTGEKSRRPYDITREDALNDMETRTTFIRHLRQLRVLADEFIAAIQESLSHMPYGMRYIARELRRALTAKFPDEPESQVMKVVGHLVYYRYINPAIVAPESFDVIETTISPLQRKNLAEIAKMLNQVSVGKHFNEDNMFLQPLNNYVGYTSAKFLSYSFEVTEVVDPEVHFQVDEFTDLATLNKPAILMSIGEIQTMHQAIEANLEYIAPPIPEQIKQRFGSYDAVIGIIERRRKREGRANHVGSQEAMQLHRLFLETKRKWLSILPVQSGGSLLEILERPVGADDESRWRAAIQLELAKLEERRQKHTAQWQRQWEAQQQAAMLRESQEAMVAASLGVFRVRRGDGYQGMLNAIARDIRTKAQRRERRRAEMRRIRITLLNLKEKSDYLGSQRQSYEEYLETCTKKLVAGGDSSVGHAASRQARKMQSVLPFTRQYFHLRDLQRSGRVPRFGSYKYSAEKLYYKGVIVSVEGYPPRQLDKISLTISSDVPGVFDVQVSLMGVKMPGGGCEIQMQDLLQLQYDNVHTMTLYEGSVVVNTNLLVFLINKKFYS
ncbi:RasGAP-domain-containing protein [Coemansia reversa NRRL 1564]|uniref:RasGAP-domain-containing protein n=1 Tax=Coemansia reversa (strain ATCC 12441 / NRRL 1564) TaxID=763665 RepID=A0A2G5BAL1_COERN|nr:RasGAP-domain-containing protein [Coemansia reversa NRRL 1564]|eukprot:PIA15757.1 RasGAP-domain-containing protein [Coemansia reversa NRRL 1564]